MALDPTARRGWLAAGAIGAALAGITLALALDAPRSPRRRPAAPVVRAAPPAPAPPVRRAPSASDARTVAARFAAAYAAWDAGRRSPAVAARLARTATPALLATLARDRARPVARTARPIPLEVGVVAPGQDGTAVVALMRAHRTDAHVATLVVALADDGPRVVRLRR